MNSESNQILKNDYGYMEMNNLDNINIEYKNEYLNQIFDHHE